MDGVDAALARVHFAQDTLVSAELIAAAETPYPEALRRRLCQAARGQPLAAGAWAQLDRDLGDHFTEAARALLAVTQTPPESVVVVGSHGQTVLHDAAGGVSVQLGGAARIAEALEVPVAYDFRAADLAAGGVGAPLVPYLDRWLFGGARRRAVLNLGGIANVTLMTGGRLVAFDTGPGNALLDALAQETLGTPYDLDGAGAERGKVHAEIAARFLSDPYFQKPPPKSTGQTEFGPRLALELLTQVQSAGGSGDDALATALELTVRPIAGCVHQAGVEEVVASGGGVKNRALMRRLIESCAPATVSSSAAYGVDPDAKEALAFAVLAAARVRGVAAAVPEATGAQGARVLGALVDPRGKLRP